jgi:Predicted nucleic acid-binding protein, contains PIN domain
VIAVDTNILVYAHRVDAPHHRAARSALAGLVESGDAWAIPWPCVHEFIAITTHRRVFSPPTPTEEALDAITVLFDTSGVRVIGETERHLGRLAELVTKAGVSGPKIHDARIAAICLTHGVRALWTADRDFSYFPDLHTVNPLVA